MHGCCPNGNLVLRAEAIVDAVEIAVAAKSSDDLLPGQRDQLLDYSGMGPMAHLFEDGRGRFAPGYEAVGARLKSVLDTAAYGSMQASVLTSYYTAPGIAEAMVKAAREAGVGDDAAVLEPGCGVGRFMDAAPAGWRFTGVERDQVAAKIAGLRHPDAQIIARDLRDVRLAAAFDLAIGNVPFGEVTYRLGARKLPVADYFIARAVDALRPGGVAVLLASRYFLDKGDEAARRMIGERARLVDVARLPSDLFIADGAEVVTDVLVFHREPETDAGAAWFSTTTKAIAATGHAHRFNGVFEQHPQKVLGALAERSGPFGPTLAVTSTADPAAAVRAWSEGIATVYSAQGVADGGGDGEPTDAVEGTLLIGDDGVIRASRGGRLEAVVSHGKRLSIHDKGAIAQRTAAKIALAEARARIIAAQQNGEPKAAAEAARSAGIALYMDFVRRFGPINKTERSVDANGEERLRHPNLGGPFRRDPRHALVMAMEDYDDATGAAKPGAVLLRDVVLRQEEPTTASSPTEALMVSQTWRGRVDMPFIASLCGKSQKAVIADLGDKVFRDPDTAEWLVADEYLSGRVAAKLDRAREAAELVPEFKRNVLALEAVQPEPLTDAEIDIRLGSPVLTPAHVIDFANHVFKVTEGIQVVRPLPDMWRVSADYMVARSVPASVDFGTDRMNGIEILEAALNQKRVVITDEVEDADGKKKRVINVPDTMAACDKLALLREAFRTWVFSDEDRTAEIVAEYNRRFNGFRQRRYFGGHLTFPGLEMGRSLRPHQKDAVWRALASSSNTLLAHFVGSGKTLCVSAIAMKSRQIGIAKRPMLVVPNHLTGQIAREFATFYPTGRVLVATPEDFTREGRQGFLAKITHGDFDLIVIGMSSFERIPVSPEAAQEFISNEIARMRVVLASLEMDATGKTATRRAKRAIETQIQKAEARLLDACNRKRDAGIVWEELQVDALYIDEAHFYKNLSFATKMRGVKGLNPDGSQRADDLYMKVRITERMSRVKGPVVFATATPLANSLAEAWTFMRYLSPGVLEDLEIDSFDNFVASFAEVVTSLEITPDGAGMTQASRLAKFVNVPELLLLWSQIADVITPDMANIPKPRIAGGGVETVSVELTDEARAIQRDLVNRMERIKNGGVKPEEDNALAVTTDGRLLALDPRLVDGSAGPGEKVGVMADRIAAIWRETADVRGTQLVFSSLGVHPSKRTGFCFYDALISELVDRGVPRSDIVTCREEIDTPAKEARVHADLRSGRKRIAIYNDAKGGTGLNVQERLCALHIAELPWRPSDQEQRIGRIERQGNKFFDEVRIIQYVSTRSFDARMAQLLQSKSAVISSIMRGDVDARTIEEISSETLSYAELKSIASGEPAFLAEAELVADIRKLETLRSSFEGQQRSLIGRKARLPGLIAEEQTRVASLRIDVMRREKHRQSGVWVGGVQIADKAEAGKALEAAVLQAKMQGGGDVGMVDGFTLTLATNVWRTWILEFDTDTRLSVEVGKSGGGQLLYRVRAAIDGLDKDLSYAETRLERLQAEAEDVSQKIGEAFQHADLLEELRALHKTIEREMTMAPAQRDRMALDQALRDHARLKDATRRAEKSAARKRSVAKSVSEAIMAEAAQTEVVDQTAGLDQNTTVLPPQTDAAHAPDANGSTAGVVMFAKGAGKGRKASHGDNRQMWLFPEVA